jgi:hypothetical protein
MKKDTNIPQIKKKIHHKRAYFRIHKNHIGTRVSIKLNQAMAFFCSKEKAEGLPFF